MAPKKAYPLRLDGELYEALRRWADSELRSVNGQIEYILKQAVEARGFYPLRGKGLARETAPPPTDPA